MKQIMLAAGKGTRLRPLTSDVPKPLVTVAKDDSIFDINVRESAQVNRIRETIVVIGYQADTFRSAIRTTSTDLPISVVENERYDSTGPVYSLSLGVDDGRDDDFTVQNGDTIYARSALQAITAANTDGIHVAVSRSREYEPDDMKVILDDGDFETVGKSIPTEPDAKSAGLVSVRGWEYRDAFKDAVETLLEKESKVYWHEILNELSSRGIAVEPIEIDDDSWWEIDTKDDLKRVRSIYE